MLNRLDDLIWIDGEDESKEIISEEVKRDYISKGFSDLTQLGYVPWHMEAKDVPAMDRVGWENLLGKLKGADMLPYIADGSLKHLIDNTSFLEDGLFCEWAYFIDLEAQELEIWAYGDLFEVMKFEEFSEQHMKLVQKRYNEETYEDSEATESEEENDNVADDGNNGNKNVEDHDKKPDVIAGISQAVKDVLNLDNDNDDTIEGAKETKIEEDIDEASAIAKGDGKTDDATETAKLVEETKALT